MKLCENCNKELCFWQTTLCAECEAESKAALKRAKRNAARKAREDALRSCGLVKVRGALGGTYWE
jgi:predicted amidophosphoribosyltransferase